MIELLIVMVIVPVIVGALSYGLLSIFSLQTGVSNRLTDTEDAQVVAANFENDVQSAYNITTVNNIGSYDCGPGVGTQILGLELNEQGTGPGQIPTPGQIVSYVTVPGTGHSTSLERLDCTNVANLSNYGETTLAYDVTSASLPVVDPICAPAYQLGNSGGYPPCTSSAALGWTPAFEFSQILLPVEEAKTNYTYTLVAAPAASTSDGNGGSPVGQSTTTSCNYAVAGAGTYAANLCFVDFTSLSEPGPLAAASQAGGCLEMSANIGGNNTLYFCLNISGVPVGPYPMPTYNQAFLGNTNSQNTSGQLYNVPEYTGVTGEPALYTDPASGSANGGTTTLTFSNITVVTSAGQLATGWQIFSADAESTDTGEYLEWTTSPASAHLTILSNGISTDNIDTSTDPVGNACANGLGLFYVNYPSTTSYTYANNGGKYNQVVCEAEGGTTSPEIPGPTIPSSDDSPSGWKTGAAMVTAGEPTSLIVQMKANGLQAIAFGVDES